ncbi:MAG TPA: DUF4349 domain-containing protein [Flavobacteriaceae bacterium]|nr:DUF4349 domain-containing protein [Flavobacteriaceae bacterium]MCB9211956.1 DUF4349 domain-containing protein [Alteromonas sp.]HPF09950.1 DUF4349 domain-containing protein [Flavobacteriaceae bacterium]HQU20047.1 DUF4349 domain-containing protein [Flavobacteriaceae bacterium]HQU63967.1 DUF4349 domain-containing protein [Flavobacteriaceae bacterium]
MKTISLFLFGFLLACSNGGNGNYQLSKSETSADYDYQDEPLSEEIYVEDDGISEKPLEAQDQKIIKTAQLRFESSKPDETHQRIIQLTQQYKGFVQGDNAGKQYNRIYRNMVIRIPTDNFQSFIDGISEGVPYFEQKDISRQDVSEEFVDLEARLKAKHELEKRYLELLKQAKNVKEMLEIERELANIREEIEAKQGRLNYLQNKVSLSTVNIEFYKQTAETGVTLSYGQKMVNALKGGWDGISMFFIGLLYLWPLFIVVLIGILLLRRYIKRSRKKTSK